ncbi:MAG TPA: hypothetical protein VG013_22780, partial [Gemmataceae bacterium]|nr:hypothetical protein [Gemmataceae bacterium]
RILGLILARQGKLEQAHALLLPYAEEHLKRLHKAEETLGTAVRAVHEQIHNEAQVGPPPGFPLERYRRAGKVEQQRIEQEYVLARMKAAPAVKAAEAAIVRESAVVPVALDVGIVLLRRAQAEVDPAKRRAGLERAEKMFLAVRGQAQESDEYRLFLGQVYYWLGKHAEGRKLFDALLKEHHRSYQSLTEVSELLHEIGALAEGRALASEAYRKEDDADKKYAAAGLRATMALDTDDQITWLRRSNPADAGIKALLQAALGDKAMAEGKDEAAAEHLRQAADLYARQPENAVTFNNGGLVYIRLYRVSGDQEALDKAAAMFEKALALQGGDSIVLSNAAGSMLDRALRDVIGAAIDFKALKAGGSVEMLFYLYRDQSGREKYVRRLRTDAGVAKALAYYDRLAVLRPKRASPYSNLLSIYAYRRDPEALRGLLRRLEGVDLDLSDETRQALDFYAGKDDAKRRKEWKAGIQRQQDSVRVARKGARGATLAVAASTLADLKMSLDQLGEAVDAAEVVALAEEAHAAAPSQATQSSLVRALLFRAGQTLARQEPPYTAMVTRARRSLSPSYLLAVGLSLDAKLRDAARKNPDVQRAVALVLQETREFPDDPSPWSWALLRGVHPEEAAKVAKALRKDELGRLERSITQQLTPVGAGTAFAACWALQAAGKEAEARAVLKACARRGVPMPFEVK